MESHKPIEENRLFNIMSIRRNNLISMDVGFLLIKQKA